MSFYCRHNLVLSDCKRVTMTCCCKLIEASTSSENWPLFINTADVQAHCFLTMLSPVVETKDLLQCCCLTLEEPLCYYQISTSRMRSGLKAIFEVFDFCRGSQILPPFPSALTLLNNAPAFCFFLFFILFFCICKCASLPSEGYGKYVSKWRHLLMVIENPLEELLIKPIPVLQWQTSFL